MREVKVKRWAFKMIGSENYQLSLKRKQLFSSFGLKKKGLKTVSNKLQNLKPVPLTRLIILSLENIPPTMPAA